MIHFLLPPAHPLVFQNIRADVRETEPQVAVSHSLCNYMNELKEKITTREKEWDVYKKYTNPYEYIHSLVPHKKKSVSKYKPISRSYFKMVEIISEFNIIRPAVLQTSISRSTDSFDFIDAEKRRKKHSLEQNHVGTTQAADLYQRFENMPPFTFPVEPPLYSAHNNPALFLRDAPLRHPPLLRSGALGEATELFKTSHLFPRLNASDNFCKSYPSATTLGALSEATEFIAIRTFHLAEGPGGFIEAVCNRRNNREDQYYGMTILVDEYDDNVPAWNKTGHFLAQHPNIVIETGADGTGNLLHIENYDYCVAKYAGTMDLVTADGGFDFSKDFNKQEVSITNLLWGQVCYALALQRKGGNFVLKIFDCFYEHTIDILYILSAFYSEVHVSKLQTSRVGNSEKYVVCKGFRFSAGLSFEDKLTNGLFLSTIRESFQRICVEVNPFSSFRRYVWRILDKPVPRHFTKQIEDMNSVFGQQQIENIHYTISLIDKQSKTEKSDQILRQNINKCVNWCIDHEIPHNNLTSTNVFVHPTSETTVESSSRELINESC